MKLMVQTRFLVSTDRSKAISRATLRISKILYGHTKTTKFNENYSIITSSFSQFFSTSNKLRNLIQWHCVCACLIEFICTIEFSA